MELTSARRRDDTPSGLSLGGDVAQPVPAGPAGAAPMVVEPLLSSALRFEAFYRAERDRVGRALAVTFGDDELAAEAVDEAMARAYARWSKVSAYDNPGGWVYRVGLNWGISVLRRRKRSSTTEDPIGASGAPHVRAADGHEPAVAAALAALSPERRAVVVCRLLLGWSERQTAAALRIRPGTVKSRLHRASAELQAHLHHLRPEASR